VATICNGPDQEHDRLRVADHIGLVGVVGHRLDQEGMLLLRTLIGLAEEEFDLVGGQGKLSFQHGFSPRGRVVRNT
jgi:hypothetical protein